MARVTDDFVLARFFALFAQMPEAEQRGILRGLEANRLVAMARTKPEETAPLLQDVLEEHWGSLKGAEEA